MEEDLKKHHLERLDRSLVCRGKIVDLYQDSVRLPDGKIEKWDYVQHKKGGGAAVVAPLPDGRILMVRQYRPAVDEICLELPAGAREDEGEDTMETAGRELLEETGYRAESLQKLLSIRAAIAWCNEFTDIYLAQGIEKVSSQHLDEAEEIRVVPCRMKDLLSMISSGKISDAKTAAGILAWQCRLGR